jgi:hypothetical protein
VNFTAAFADTGLDLGGPLFTTDGKKVWICLFTCMAVRAVHLELVPGLTAEATERAITRFSSRRGTPKRFYSDHGTNFVAVSKRIGVPWTFMVERGPWWGGAWERLIGTTKGLLKRTLGKRSRTFEELTTDLASVEAVINGRPVSYQWTGAERGGVPAPITPQIFLRPPGGSLDVQGTERWGREIAEAWRQEYLVGVLGKAGEVWGSAPPRRIKRGSVVLIHTYGKRGTWPLGVVVRLIAGADGRNRVAVVRTKTGEFRRPVQKLYPIEVPRDDEEADDVGKTSSAADGAPSPSDSDGAPASSSTADGTVTRVGRQTRLPARFKHN